MKKVLFIFIAFLSINIAKAQEKTMSLSLQEAIDYAVKK